MFNLEQERWIVALLIMLKDDALDYYYDDIQPILTSTTSFDGVTSMIRDYFEGPEYRRGVQQMWHNTNLISKIAKTPEKSVKVNFEFVLLDLNNLQNERNIDEENMASDEEVFPSMSETENKTFTTSFGKINAYDVLSSLTNQATYHAVTKDTFNKFYTDDEKLAINVTNGTEVFNLVSTDRYGRKAYYGILIGTGASSRSKAGYSQYLAYNDYHEDFLI
ncbi:hypothetical protein GcC1_025040 [Golovinomyces cichoracearum]|uniref:Uncharacterized protein n=1 Tax=Golovinomyces cichoracearum TaxID=62708 RepID=A0A420J423_9PEZI|nr:hypothetical protein GcC1_025040 [Golovinomyces cichoracearum]